VYTFLPIVLALQFKKVINLFYVVNVLLQSIPAISVNSPYAALGPLLVVIMLGVLKELVLECQRYQADKKANSCTIEHIKTAKPYSDLKQEQLDELKQGPAWVFMSKNERVDSFKVGDFVLLKDGDIVPTDCIVLETANRNGECYI
jgi:magnesium-transporting ATPase (P-type)